MPNDKKREGILMPALLKKRLWGIAFATLSLAIVWFVPAPEGMSQAGWYLSGVLISSLIMWLTEAFPKVVVTLYIIGAVAILGIFDSMATAMKFFMSQPILMVIGSFFIAAMLDNTNLPFRLVGFLVRFSKDNGKAFLLIIMIATAFAASVLADMAAAMIFFAFVVSVFGMKRREITPDNLGLKKALMIAIPISAFAGSLCIPIGGPVNLIVIGMLEGATGISISFAQWFLIMGPISLIIIVTLWFWLCVTLKPGRIEKEQYESFVSRVKELGPWNANEIKALIILFGMIALWFAGSWMPIFANGMVVIIGVLIMYCPGIDIITRENFEKEASWDLFFFLSGIMIIAQATQDTGLITWIIDNSFSWLAGANPILVVFISSVILLIMRICIPAGPPVIIMSVPALITIGLGVGINPVVMASIGCVWGVLAFIMPAEVIKALTYEFGYFKIFDMWKAEIPTIVTLLAILTFFIPFIVGVVMPA